MNVTDKYGKTMIFDHDQGKWFDDDETNEESQSVARRIQEAEDMRRHAKFKSDPV